MTSYIRIILILITYFIFDISIDAKYKISNQYQRNYRINLYKSREEIDCIVTFLLGFLY